MRDHDRQVLASSKQPNWRTPRPLFHALHAEFGFSIDLAACAADSTLDRWLGPESPLEDAQDALAFHSWHEVIDEFAFGFLNPPYSRKLKMSIAPWIERCWQTSLDGRGVVAIVPAAVQTQWWQAYVVRGGLPAPGDGAAHRASEIRFFPHRLSFDPPHDEPGKESGNANVNTAIVVWRPYNPFLLEPWAPQVRYWSCR